MPPTLGTAYLRLSECTLIPIGFETDALLSSRNATQGRAYARYDHHEGVATAVRQLSTIYQPNSRFYGILEHQPVLIEVVIKLCPVVL